MTRPIRISSAALALYLASCSSKPLAIDPIGDQTVVRNTVRPREITVAITLPDGPSSFEVALSANDPDVVADQSFSCEANPCRITFAPSPAKTARVVVQVGVEAGDLAGQTSFGLDVVPLLVLDRSDGDPPAPGSLRDMVSRVEDGDVVAFDVDGAFAGSKHIELGSPIVVDHDVTIEGPGADQLTVSGAEETSLFTVAASSALRLSGLELADSFTEEGGAVTVGTGCGLTVMDGRFVGNRALQGAAIHAEQGTVEVRNTEFRGNASEGDGGAIFHDGPALRISTGSRFLGNTAATAGGAVYAGSGEVVIEDASFGGSDEGDGNRAYRGGAVNVRGDTSLAIAGSSFVANDATDRCGALCAEIDGEATVEASVFDGNTADWYAGAALAAGPVSLRDTEFSNHVASGAVVVLIVALDGGATVDRVSIRDSRVGDGVLLLSEGVVALDDVEISGNIAEECAIRGAGLTTQRDAIVAVTGSRFLDNTCLAGGGGGLYADGAVTVTGSELRGNTASSGGGVYVSDEGDVQLLDTVVAENGSEGSLGGGAYVEEDGRLTLDQGTQIIGNHAERGYGGGIYVRASATLAVEEALIGRGAAKAGNQAGQGGGIYTQGHVTLGDATEITSNLAERGGGIYQTAAAADLSMGGATVEDNVADDQGGGMYIANGAYAATTDVTITLNRAGTPQGGGGIYWQNTGPCSFPRQRVFDNRAGDGDGAVNNIYPFIICDMLR